MRTQHIQRFAMLSPGAQTVARFGKQIVNSCVRTGGCAVVAVLLAVSFATNAIAQTEIAKSRPVATPAPVAIVPADGPLMATGATVTAAATRTTFNLSLTGPVAVHVFALGDPYRVVVDMPDLQFDLADGIGARRQGLITGFRYGMYSTGRSRIVIDTAGPTQIARSGVVGPLPDGRFALQIELVASTPSAFADAMALAAAAGAGPPVLPPSPAPPANRQPASDKLVIMIDPGHGGIDGGASSATGTREKDVVLMVAQRLKAALEQRGRYDVRMTRTSDRFVPLDQRVALSQAAGAGLFISIHADAVDDAAVANSVHGATVYTMSDHASSEAAQALADKENAADAASGQSGADVAATVQVNSILADLTQRETLNFSTEFRHLLLQRLRPANVLAHDPARSAGFKVLRQVQTPTVLIELGFLSNPDDAARLQQAEWQKSFASAIAAAVDSYAAKRPPR